MNTRETDVIVIGGGVIGLAAAHYLLGRGRSVRILDMGDLGNGSSRANCGLITPSHAPPLAAPGMIRKSIRWMLDPRSPFYVKPTLRPSTLFWFLRFAGRCNRRDMRRAMAGRSALLNSSRALYDDMLREHRLDCEWENKGVLMVYATGKEMHALDALEPELAELGVPSRSIPGNELEDLEPALRSGLYGGRLYAVDAHLRPDRLVTELGRVVRERGGSIEEGCRVEGFSVNGDRIRTLRTSRGDRTAESYVLATGAWSPELGRNLGIDVPIQPGKGYTVTMERPRACPAVPLILMETKIAVTPWPSGYRLGGTMEFAGYSEGLNPQRIEAILSGAARYLREPVGEGARESWYGWRPMSPDEMPIIGPAPRYPNLLVAAGHGMLGVSMAPATGKLVSELITGSPPHVDPTPYRLDRF